MPEVQRPMLRDVREVETVKAVATALHHAMRHPSHGGGWDHNDGDLAHALIDALEEQGLTLADVTAAREQAATEARRELLAKVWREFGADAHTIARIERLIEEPR